jgi:hypothetical protein
MFDANDTPVKQKNDHTSESHQILPQWKKHRKIKSKNR